MDVNTPNSEKLSQLRKEIASALSSADARASQSVQDLQLVHQARLARLTRTAETLKGQHGPNDPQVKQAEADVAAATATVGRISLVQAQVSTPPPDVSAQGWALQGRVYDGQFRPASGYTVFLVDAEKTYQRAYGFAYTDATGYFLLQYAGAEGQAAPPQLFLAAADATGRPVFLSDTAFAPAPGSATYQNIILPSGDQPLGNPPEQIRNVALPGEHQA